MLFAFGLSRKRQPDLVYTSEICPGLAVQIGSEPFRELRLNLFRDVGEILVSGRRLFGEFVFGNKRYVRMFTRDSLQELMHIRPNLRCNLAAEDWIDPTFQ